MKMENNDAHILSQIYRSFPGNRHLEIGTWRGFGAATVVRNCSSEVVTLNLEDGEKIDGQPVYELMDGLPSDSRHCVGQYYIDGGYDDRITQIFGDSKTLNFGEFSSSLFDTVLIDGGHDFETVINDTNKVISVVKPGGLVIWHDFIPDPDVISSHPAAKGVVTAAIKNWKLMRENFEVLCWIRPSWILFGIRKK